MQSFASRATPHSSQSGDGVNAHDRIIAEVNKRTLIALARRWGVQMALGATCVGVMQLGCRVGLRSCANRRCRCTHKNTRQKTTWGQAEALKGTCECVSLFNSGTHVCTHTGPCVRRPWCRQVQAHAHQRALFVWARAGF
jgi:hypothetical protein